MAARLRQSILVCEMVVGAYIEWLSLTCCIPGRRRAIERFGAGWPLLSSPTYLPQKATLPGSHTKVHSGVAPARPGKSHREGGDGW